MEYFIILVVFAVCPAMIAHSKGRNPVLWFFYGLAVLPIALTHSILIEKDAAGRGTAIRKDWDNRCHDQN